MSETARTGLLAGVVAVGQRQRRRVRAIRQSPILRCRNSAHGIGKGALRCPGNHAFPLTTTCLVAGVGRLKLEPLKGIEPPTSGLRKRRSTN
jgi:hypothetical protein